MIVVSELSWIRSNLMLFVISVGMDDLWNCFFVWNLGFWLVGLVFSKIGRLFGMCIVILGW